MRRRERSSDALKVRVGGETLMYESGVGRNPAPLVRLSPHTPIPPSLILCHRQDLCLAQGKTDVVQDFANGTIPKPINVRAANIKHGVEGWRCCVLLSGAGFLPHTVLGNAGSTAYDVSPRPKCLWVAYGNKHTPHPCSYGPLGALHWEGCSEPGRGCLHVIGLGAPPSGL